MPRIAGSPKGFLSSKETQKILKMGRQAFWQAGLSEFLQYYKIGQVRLYVQEDVINMRHYLMIQRGLAALGLITPSPPAPLLPPGETAKEKRNYFDGWLVEDLYSVPCPQCDGMAVTSPDENGPVWCEKCGIKK